MNYFVNGREYAFNYGELKDQYNRFCYMSDVEFVANIADIIHFACFVSYLKNLSINQTLSDDGIIHELAHVAALYDVDPIVDLIKIRRQFEDLLRLS